MRHRARRGGARRAGRCALDARSIEGAIVTTPSWGRHDGSRRPGTCVRHQDGFAGDIRRKGGVPHSSGVRAVAGRPRGPRRVPVQSRRVVRAHRSRPRHASGRAHDERPGRLRQGGRRVRARGCVGRLRCCRRRCRDGRGRCRGNRRGRARRGGGRRARRRRHRGRRSRGRRDGCRRRDDHRRRSRIGDGCGRRRGRTRRQQAEGIDVALLLRRTPDSEMDARDGLLGRSARSHRPDRRALRHRVALRDADRAEMDEGHREAVCGEDRDAAAVRGQRPGERDDARRGRADRRSACPGDVDATMLTTRVRVRAEHERPQHRAVGRP